MIVDCLGQGKFFFFFFFFSPDSGGFFLCVVFTTFTLEVFVGVEVFLAKVLW